VTNNGPSEALDTVVVDSISNLSGALNALPSQGSCSGTEPVTCNLGPLANGATATIMLTGTVEPTFVGPVTDTANVESAAEDPDTNNNQTVLAQLRGFALDFAESKKLLPYESVPGLWITTENRL
jgi:hypothetical protein